MPFVKEKIKSVVLSDEEIQFIEELARLRSDPKKNFHYQGFNLNSLSFLERGFLGLLGEMAVSKLLDVEIDMELYGLKGDGLKGDLNYRGFSVSVKYTNYRSGNLMLYENPQDDLYILCCQGRGEKSILPPDSVSGDRVSRVVDVVGWVDQEKFLSGSEIREGKKRCRFYSRDLLFPLDTLEDGVEFL